VHASEEVADNGLIKSARIVSGPDELKVEVEPLACRCSRARCAASARPTAEPGPAGSRGTAYNQRNSVDRPAPRSRPVRQSSSKRAVAHACDGLRPARSTLQIRQPTFGSRRSEGRRFTSPAVDDHVCPLAVEAGHGSRLGETPRAGGMGPRGVAASLSPE
jgi:hypothetical protein